jgi:hypothetical protein
MVQLKYVGKSRGLIVILQTKDVLIHESGQTVHDSFSTGDPTRIKTSFF